MEIFIAGHFSGELFYGKGTTLDDLRDTEVIIFFVGGTFNVLKIFDCEKDVL